MTDHWDIHGTDLFCGDCLEILKQLPDNCVDSVVTDPPYGLKFMGKRWDYDVPGVETWKEVLRVLKPGGHLLSFAGTRTQHRMAVNIEDAGFEIRDMIAWVYGCLSEDTEILTRKGWMRYHRAKQEEVLAYDVQADVYEWEKPSRWHEYCVESDTAFAIRGDHTDQVVSRGHRCIVERDGELVFVSAEELLDVERMPILRDAFLGLQEGRKPLLQPRVQRGCEGPGVGETRLQGPCSLERGVQEVPFREDDRDHESLLEGRRDILPQARELQTDQIRSVPAAISAHGEKGRLHHGTQATGGEGHGAVLTSDGSCSPRKPRSSRQPTGELGTVCQQPRSQIARTRASYQTHLARVERFAYSGVFWCPTVSTGAFVARRNGKVFITGNSGFPKSLDVSKALDKAAGAKREVVGKNPTYRKDQENAPSLSLQHNPNVTAPAPATDAARQWEGWGTALKPSLEPITVARKPFRGTVAANVLEHGTGAINVDGCRVGTSSTPRKDPCNGILTNAHMEMRPWMERRIEAGEPLKGDFDGTQGRWPANLIHDGSEEVVGLFPESKSGTLTPDNNVRSCSGWSGGSQADRVKSSFPANKGSAARFFYCAKTSRKEREIGCENIPAVTGAEACDRKEGTAGLNNPRAGAGRTAATVKNIHPTVKPLALMRYLVRLVTPPGGAVLDPFTGSGTTLIAAVQEGFSGLGMEQDRHSCEIAAARLQAAKPTKGETP